MTHVAADSTPTKKPLNTWAVLACLLAALVLLGNPWTQNAYFEFLVSGIWERGAGYSATAMAGMGVGICMLILCGGIAFVVGEIKGSWKSMIVGAALFIATSAFSWGPMATHAISVDDASYAIANLKMAEDNNGATVPARAELERATASFDALKNSQAVVRSYNRATVTPESLMGILAAADALPVGHPATQFVIENNMARPEDVRAIQVALLNQARAGDANSRTALALLSGMGSGGNP